MLNEIYDEANLEASKIAIATGFSGDGKTFSFKDYPKVKARVTAMLNTYAEEMQSLIYSSTSKEWKKSNLVQDLFADGVLKKKRQTINGKRLERYYQTNPDALKAFQERTDRGMNLSDKIWQQSIDYRRELEAAISCGIEDGISAVTLSKRVSKYLTDFPLLKKEYTQRFGKADNLFDCEYRSMRLVRSEINMAYRTAEQTRWQQFDFVVGYEIKLSKVHHHRMPDGDICDELAGKYPKDFNWTGWHPNDLCYVVPILKTDDEIWKLDDTPSKNEVTDVPEGFKRWVNVNKERIDEAKERGTMPYFLRDNRRYVKITSAKDIAEIRHANRDEDAIRRAWTNRKILKDEYYSGSIASIRKHAKLVGEDISNLEKFISTTKLEVGKDGVLPVSMQLEIDNKLDKINNQIIAKYNLLDDAKANALLELGKYASYKNFSKEFTDRIKSITITSDRKLHEAINEVNRIKESMSEEFNIFSSKPIKVVNLHYSFKDSILYGNASDKDKFDFLRTSLEHLFGSSVHRQTTYKDIFSLADKGNYSEALVKLIDIYKKDCLDDVMSSVNKIKLLDKVDLSNAPKHWIAKYNDNIMAINSYDINRYGYFGVWKEIESSYNIFKLSNDSQIVRYGLNKISVNTPYKLIVEFRNIGVDPMMYLAKKEFYDGFERFVPLITRSDDNAFYGGKYGYVRIGFGDRIKRSDNFKVRIQYHEYGHAMDFEKGNWHFSSEWESLFDKYEKVFRIEKTKIHSKYWDVYFKTDGTFDDKEKFIALSDILQSFDENFHFDGHGGHTKEYNKLKTNRIMEFIAHASENFWQGNSIFKEIMPSLYREMNEMYKKYFYK